jgi:hypothetical protein
MPPLDDIAELNLQHYQVSSDLSNILSVSAIPLLAIYGFPQSAEEISAGASEALALPESARSEYIEPSGNSFDAQFKQLEQIESKINGLGLAAVLGAKLVGETAEAKRIDRSQGDSTMMVVAQQMQDMIDNCCNLSQAAAKSIATSWANVLNRKRSRHCCSSIPLARSPRTHC